MVLLLYFMSGCSGRVGTVREQPTAFRRIGWLLKSIHELISSSLVTYVGRQRLRDSAQICASRSRPKIKGRIFDPDGFDVRRHIA
jgi:hypothetical protein